MLTRVLMIAVCVLWARLPAAAQETSSGISVPVTISGDLRQEHDGDHAVSYAGFRAVVAPSLRLGPHWFIYAALDAHSSSYFPYGTGIDDDRFLQVDMMQAFVGYLRGSSKRSILIKAGQISSAFGSFPINYDDATMPVVDAPLPYTANLPLRPDQLPCGAGDVLRQAYEDSVVDHCGGSNTERYGITPVTLYGLPSIEVQVALNRFDARLQITNSSPANPHGLLSNSQFAQWTAGGGYTFRQGFHVGASAFRGPYLDDNLVSLLPAGASLRDFPAAGVGTDARWSRGHWTAQGEWMHFNFGLPGFVISPSETAAYAVIKRIVSPRVFVAAALNAQDFGRIQDASGVTAAHLAAPQQFYELSLGYRLNRQQLVKVGGGWTHQDGWATSDWAWPPSKSFACEVQLVTSLNAVSKAFH